MNAREEDAINESATGLVTRDTCVCVEADDVGFTGVCAYGLAGMCVIRGLSFSIGYDGEDGGSSHATPAPNRESRCSDVTNLNRTFREIDAAPHHLGDQLKEDADGCDAPLTSWRSCNTFHRMGL